MIEETQEFTVESLGIIEDWVYDIEVEDCHNFFANNILVHNSLYIELNQIVNFFPDSVKKDKRKTAEAIKKFVDQKLQPVVDAACKDVFEGLNCYENAFAFKIEKISQAAIWRGKKRYVLAYIYNEGVWFDEPQISVTGIEVNRASTPNVCRKTLKTALHKCLLSTESDLQDYVKECKDEFMNFSPEQIAFPRTANNMGKYGDNTTIYKGGTPFHVRAALMYNKYVKDSELESEFKLVGEGEKIKFFYMKVPNPMRENAFACVDKMPPDMAPFIDKETQWDKAFMGPINNILTTINWSAEKRFTIDDFF